MARWILIILLSVSFIVTGRPEFLAGWPLVARMAAYPLFHANVFHLAGNCLAIYLVYTRRHSDNLRCLVIGWLISCLVYPLASLPLVGVSNIIYATIGLRTPPISNRWWRDPSVLVFLGVTVAMLLVPKVAALTHIVAFVTGAVIASISRTIKQVNHDSARYLR